MWLGTGKNLALWLLWSHSHTQAGGAGVFRGPLQSQRAVLKLQSGWCLRRPAWGFHPALPPAPRPTAPCLCFHISKWGLMAPCALQYRTVSSLREVIGSQCSLAQCLAP